jgi:hypothetical protein
MKLSLRTRAALLAAGLSALFVANTVGPMRTARQPLDLFRGWRSFDDVALGAGYAARGDFLVAPYRVRDYTRREKDPRFVVFRDRLIAEMTAGKTEPMAFWRTVPAAALSEDNRWLVTSRLDDNGRALVLGLAFRALGGAAPYLIFWLGVLAALPLVAWITMELAATRQVATAVVFAFALGVSAFVVDLLTLGYSATGFHLLGAVAVIPLAVYGVHARPTVPGLLARAAVTGAVFAVCALCRGTVPTMAPGFALAIGLATARVAAPGLTRARRFGVGALALVLVAAPHVALHRWSQTLVDATREAYNRETRPRHHDAAFHIWRGLGDFDRTKGHVFTDKAVEEAVMRVDPQGQPNRESEVRLRGQLLDDVRADPLWLAGILAKRVAVTVCLYKLWPWGPAQGISFRPATSVNEGFIDTYYTLTRQADWFAVGGSTVEMPAVLLMVPMAVLAALACVPASRMRGPSWDRRRAGARRALAVLACPALAVLPTPVAITTATALETECFVLVHFLALAALVQLLMAERGATMTAET